ncbi:hypothetical protein GRI39_14290, partial [Altererythrobacter indicus]
APEITSGGSVSLDENTTAVLSVVASDSDGDSLSYAIAGGADGALFTINAAGELSFKAAPDFENPADSDGDNVYDVIVSVSDGVTTTQQSVTVTVNDVNDAPVLTGPSGLSLAENTKTVGTITASDDEGDDLTFSLTGGVDADLFTINATTGALSFKVAPDYEAPGDDDGDNAYQLEVTVSDGTTSTVQQITVSVTDANDAPVITSSNAVTITENRSNVMIASASDVDSGDTLVWSIAGGADKDLFTVDSATGALSFITAPDYEAPSSFDGGNVYAVVLQVSDGNGGVTTQSVNVTVEDANEAPVITSVDNFSITENKLGAFLVEARDDEGQDLTWSIIGGADRTKFSIDADTGAVSFLDKPDYENPSDFDEDGVYSIIVSVSDGTKTTQQNITITVTDENDAPVITSDAALTISEGLTGVDVIRASDDENSPLTWSIVGGADFRLFKIDAETGALSFIEAPDYENPGDFQSDNVYEVTVEVSDEDGATVRQNVSVTVLNTNDAPVITSQAAITMAENLTDVVTVTATDTDVADTLTYALVAGGDAALFTIDESTGELSFITPPDYENPQGSGANANEYVLTVSVSDGTNTVTQDVTVTITDANDPPVITSDAAVTMAENQTAVTTVTATDPEGDNASIVYGIADGADGALFTIDSATGELTFIAPPDFEAPGAAGGGNSYQVIVTVTDGENVTEETLTVTVEDVNEAPVITSDASISLAENESLVTTVTASDEDVADTLTYALVAGGDAALFTIDESTGELSFITPPDYENPQGSGANANEYVLTVSVSDGTNTVTQDVTVTITDANDPPVITSDAAVTMAENQTAVTTVTATDIDDDLANLTYSLVGGADAALFAIDPETGELSFVNAPDFEAFGSAANSNEYTVIVSVSDGTNVTEQTVTITLTDANDAPVITSDADISFAENALDPIQIVAEDEDVGGDTLTYAIIGGADAAAFTIDQATGAISFVTAPDYENPGSSLGTNVYEIIVEVNDGTATVEQTVTITVTDENEAPVITSAADVSLIEAQTEVIQVTAEDPDADSTLTYAIFDGAGAGSDGALFAIDAETGELSFIAPPDFENPADSGANNVYEVTVSVSDGTEVVLQNLTVTITDSNDPPVITSSDAVDVAENQTVVSTVTATDQNDDTITWSIIGGVDADLFTIDEVTGEVSFINPPDYEAPGDDDGDNVYNIIVAASDGLNTTQQALSVTVTPVQDAPVIESTVIDLAENETTVQVEASDADGDVLSYAIAGGADSALFTIDEETGELSFVTAPDFENPGDADTDNIYDLIIEVSDGTDTVQKAISVNVTDVIEGIDTTTLAEIQGFIIKGDEAGDHAGYSVSALGDVNGDGFGDLLVGANDGSDGGLKAGEAYVVFGQTGGFGILSGGRRVLDLTNLTETQGFIIRGDEASDQLGYSVSDAGDVNGDGFADIIVGAYQAGDGGAAYVVFGSGDGFGDLVGVRRVVDLTSLSEAQGFMIEAGNTNDALGFSVSSAGDINGDGYDDVIAGARSAAGEGTGSGEAYVIFGSAAMYGENVSGRKVIDVAALSASEGFVIRGSGDGDRLGASVSSAGDFNGDGYDDLIIGANRGDDSGTDAGTSYIVYGSASGFGTDISGRQVVDVSALTSDLGLVLEGDAGSRSGLTVSGAGDLNGDGQDDVIVGADEGAYVIFGRKNGAGTVTLDSNSRQTINLAGLIAAEGFLLASTGDDKLGYAISSAGDVNGDGFADLIVGTYGADTGGTDSGTAYVLFGSDQGFGTTVGDQQVVDVTALPADQGFAILGDVAGDGLGRSVSSAGDINGDGYDDIVVGAYLGDDGGSDAGEAYVIFGSAEMGAQGEQAAKTLTGTSEADILIGGNGDDIITSGGGADVIRAGAGDDRIVIADANFEDIHGGTGFDVLALDGAGFALDLTTILSGDLLSVEAIDLTGSGDNVLTISGQNLLDISDWRMGGEAYMLVTGDAGDSVVTQGFTFGGTQTYEGVTYNLYERGYANLLVSQDVAVTNAAAGVAAVVDTSILKEHYGFIIQGSAAGDELSYRSMHMAGDLNGDGYDDMVVGANANDDGGADAGAAYVIFGGASGFGALDATGRRVIDLSTPLTATEGFAILGAADSDYLGLSVSLAGDVNADGYDDLIVAAPSNDDGGADAGAAYVIFGKASGFGTIDLGSGLNAADGFKILGAADGDRLGYSVSSAGDVNGDGIDDILLGAFANGGTGSAYVIFGKTSGFGTIDLANSLSAVQGFQITGV